MTLSHYSTTSHVKTTHTSVSDRSQCWPVGCYNHIDSKSQFNSFSQSSIPPLFESPFFSLARSNHLSPLKFLFVTSNDLSFWRIHTVNNFLSRKYKMSVLNSPSLVLWIKGFNNISYINPFWQKICYLLSRNIEVFSTDFNTLRSKYHSTIKITGKIF